MKKLSISEKCIKCGECTLSTNLLKEMADGSVEPVVTSISSEQAASLNSVVKNCPVGAIVISEDKTMSFKSKAELIKYAEDKIGKFEFSKPQFEKFDKSEFSIPRFGKRSSYEYKNDSRATQAGLEEFERIMYDRKKVLASNVINQYASAKLRHLYEYVREDGNYYYENYKRIEKILQELAVAAKEVANVKLSDSFTTFDVMPNLRQHGYEITEMGNMGEMFGPALEDVESLSWYKTFVNTDSRYEYKGKKEIEMYCYDLYEVCDLLADHMMSGIRSVMSSRTSDYINSVLSFILYDVRNELSKRLYTFRDALR